MKKILSGIDYATLWFGRMIYIAVFDKEKKVMTHSRELELNLPFKCTKYIDKTPIVTCDMV